MNCTEIAAAIPTLTNDELDARARALYAVHFIFRSPIQHWELARVLEARRERRMPPDVPE